MLFAGQERFVKVLYRVIVINNLKSLGIYFVLTSFSIFLLLNIETIVYDILILLLPALFYVLSGALVLRVTNQLSAASVLAPSVFFLLFIIPGLVLPVFDRFIFLDSLLYYHDVLFADILYREFGVTQYEDNSLLVALAWYLSGTAPSFLLFLGLAIKKRWFSNLHKGAKVDELFSDGS